MYVAPMYIWHELKRGAHGENVISGSHYCWV